MRSAVEFNPARRGHPRLGAVTSDLPLARGKNSLGLERFLHSNGSGLGRARWTNEILQTVVP
jgi:hypothetical protein